MMQNNLEKVRWLILVIFAAILIWAGSNNMHLKYSEAFCLCLFIASGAITFIFAVFSKRVTNLK